MKIGIHNSVGSFSERWIPYCDDNGIDYKLVDCYKSDIIEQLTDCDALLWHFSHKNSKDCKFAKQLLNSVELAGKIVFPDYRTAWHFDDKVAQKYLLEAIGAPLVPTHVFYNKESAVKWARKTSYPIVFKLRGGAGSENVRLVRNHLQAIRLINRSFGKGFKQYDSVRNLKERLRKYREGKTTFWNILKGVVRLVYTTRFSQVSGREMGYVYFQDFLPGNEFDIRVVVIGDKAFAIKRPPVR